MNDVTRAKHLTGLSRLDGQALKLYDPNDPEQQAAVADGLKRPWPRVDPDRKRHQPPPMKESK